MGEKTMEHKLADALRICIQAEFGSFSPETVTRAGCAHTYWMDAAKVLDEFYQSVGGERESL